MKGSTMVLVMLLFAGASYASAVHAADAPAKQLTPQQQKMATCSHQAGEKALKGEERRTFLSGCLKRDSTTTTSATPAASNAGATQEKKQSCRAQAKRQHLTGGARKEFLGSCEQGAHEVAVAR